MYGVCWYTTVGRDGAILEEEIMRGQKTAGKHIINNRNIRG